MPTSYRSRDEWDAILSNMSGDSDTESQVDEASPTVQDVVRRTEYIVNALQSAKGDDRTATRAAGRGREGKEESAGRGPGSSEDQCARNPAGSDAA